MSSSKRFFRVSWGHAPSLKWATTVMTMVCLRTPTHYRGFNMTLGTNQLIVSFTSRRVSTCMSVSWFAFVSSCIDTHLRPHMEVNHFVSPI